jgi:peptidoglycan/LPS O-acetylase OafA/YrhL
VTSSSTHRLASLDGLRAVSVGLVLFAHLNGTAHFGSFRPWFGDLAHLGVTIFFVISGFLITRLLIEDENRTGRVSLRLFYLRRGLRIFPAFLAYVAVMASLSALGVVELHGRDLLHALTYTVNYEPERSWTIGHLWSLSVEEQFYLMWPFAFVYATVRGRVWIAAGTVALGPLARGGAALFLHGTAYRDMEMFPMVADSVAAGCLLACLQGWLEQRRHYLALFKAPWSWALVVAILMLNRYMSFTLVDIVGACLINMGLAILIHRSVTRADGAIGRVLNFPALTVIGALSYSLYLWQQPFINRHGTAWFNAFPQNLLLAITAALLSYWMLEKPLLRMRRALSGVSLDRPRSQQLSNACPSPRQ